MLQETPKIASETVTGERETALSRPMLVGEIAGATVWYHFLPAGEQLDFAGQGDLLRVFFVLDGDVTFGIAGDNWHYTERVCFVPGSHQDLSVGAKSAAGFLEIQWALNASEIKQMAATPNAFPIRQVYATSDQYKDYFKSDKTISRSILGQHLLPRFCMGSVESYGFDRVEPHAHPLLDQFFFGFVENDVDLLIDDQRHSMLGNTLVHIPLGSNHGVEVAEGKHMHYLWIDFIFDAKGVAYLDEVHQSTGTMRSFEKQGESHPFI